MSTPTFHGYRVLIVEDVLPLSIQYRANVKPLGVETVVAASVAEASGKIEHGPWHAALVDINLPDGTGFDVMRQMQERWPDCAVIVTSAEESKATAVRAADAGALDFIEKPVDPDRLRITLRNALQTARLADEVHKLAPGKRGQFCGFNGDSAAMRAVYQTIETVATSRAPVFIQGESGTGKELAAKAIHHCSRRARQAFVPLNCASIPKDLIESELFGHVKGAFTGATADRNGAFIEANGGTLFLDEIAELDLQVQAKLLRALQTGEVRRLGENQVRMVDVRVVSATHRNLYDRVQEGLFREDLYYRLYVIPVELPPLRERGRDILQIADFVLAKYAREDQRQFRGFTAESQALLLAYHWPGNVRELINTIRAVVALHDGERVEAGMLSGKLQAADLRPVQALAAASPAPRPASSPPLQEVAASPAILPLATVERLAIEGALRLFNGNITRAAKALQVNPSTIYRKMATWAVSDSVAA
jgi:two-component system repressor protein LuxO